MEKKKNIPVARDVLLLLLFLPSMFRCAIGVGVDDAVIIVPVIVVVLVDLK